MLTSHRCISVWLVNPTAAAAFLAAFLGVNFSASAKVVHVSPQVLAGTADA